jgi:hypothetical protein
MWGWSLRCVSHPSTRPPLTLILLCFQNHNFLHIWAQERGFKVMMLSPILLELPRWRASSPRYSTLLAQRQGIPVSREPMDPCPLCFGPTCSSSLNRQIFFTKWMCLKSESASCTYRILHDVLIDLSGYKKGQWLMQWYQLEASQGSQGRPTPTLRSF